jgi:hypothetical protein
LAIGTLVERSSRFRVKVISAVLGQTLNDHHVLALFGSVGDAYDNTRGNTRSLDGHRS